jgi:HEAT repeat protein
MELFKGDSTFASMAASSALAKIGLPAVKPLIASLQDPNPNVRIGACVALGDMNDPAIAPALQKLTLDRDSRVRKAAATALSKTKTGK